MANSHTGETQKIVALLGGTRALQRRISDPRRMRDAVRAGLPYAALEAFLVALQISRDQLTSLLGVAPRTLARRKDARRLSPGESDRLYRVAHTVRLATEVLGSLERARSWLSRSNRAMGGVTPISLLDTEIGQRQVEEVLERINHGIYS